MSATFTITGVFYPSFYIQEYEKAIAFYTQVLGPPKADEETIKGWHLGNTWLTLFPTSAGGNVPDANPRNAEFAIQVAEPAQVDVLYQALIDAGATSCWEPEDTEMYEKMRFSCVDDPFGIRIDVICPL